ncbi:MAG: KOW domain-containing RNA-binding protein [Limnochordaceae bacterium]|nr:KOW domain-containing RNA-binding protein [Limnochordaceae bacterium]
MLRKESQEEGQKQGPSGAARVGIGRVVTSRAGRDVGHSYVVVGMDERGRLLLADGHSRQVTRPKPKNVRHVWLHPMEAQAGPWTDERVRAVLNRWQEAKGPRLEQGREGEDDGKQGGCD